jgi:hypothetical protein
MPFDEENEMDPESAVPIEHPRRRWLRILAKIFLVLVGIFAVVWFGIPPRVPTRPVHLARGEDGRMVPTDASSQPGGLSFEVQAGKIAASNTFVSGSRTSRSGDAGFACGRMLILNRSNHLLMARIAQLLLDELKPLGYIRQIDYFPAGFTPEQGQLAPDVTITLDMLSLKESGLLASHMVEAKFSVTAGNAAAGCPYSCSDHLSPPLIELDWDGTLTHTSTTTGISSSGAKYKLVAENIAKQIADSLTKEFKERREKERLQPELPPAFYPPYRQPPSLPLAELGELELVSSWHGLMNHNETIWRLTIDRPAREILPKIGRRLQAAGWKETLSSEGCSYVAASNGAATLVVYVPSSPVVSPDIPRRESLLDIRYVDRMNEAELHAAIDGLLAKNTSTEALLCFESKWSEEQCQRVLKMVESRPVRTPQAALALAKLYHRLKQDDKARHELLRVCALLRTVAQYSDQQTAARKLAKELGDEKLVEKPIDIKMLKELGFIELKPGVQIPPQEVGLEEPVHFYFKKADGALTTVSLRAIKTAATGSGPLFQLAHVESTADGRSWGTGGQSHCTFLDGGGNAQFSLERLADNRFCLNARVSDK